jgi:hypothetical protein
MSIHWNEVESAINPVKNYEDLCKRSRLSFSYPLVCETYNFMLPELGSYKARLPGGDPRQRFED